MKVLVACEESQRVCTAFRGGGHEAYSCDLIEQSGGHPEWHIVADVLPLLDGNCSFATSDGALHTIGQRWDLIIAFPPCTHLCNTGQRWFLEGKKPMRLQREAIAFFYRFVMADCDRIAIENPMGIMQTAYRPADQIIHPWMFGEPYAKKTCLWLKGLPPLKVQTKTPPADVYSYAWRTLDDDGHPIAWGTPEIAKQRSKTFVSIANAMAAQWGVLEEPQSNGRNDQMALF